MPDAFICSYVRTPIGRYGGILSSLRADDLAAIPLRALGTRNKGLDWEAVDDVILGCANQAGEDNRNVARMALLLADLPPTVPGVTVNRLCGSGMSAVAEAARSIKAGEADLIIAGGVESMSRAPFVISKSETAFSRAVDIFDTTIGWRFSNPIMHSMYGTDSMPETAENVASDFSIGRIEQDKFAVQSQERARAAQESGRLAREIIPVTIEGRKGAKTLVELDEHVRPDTTLDALGKLSTPFKVTGGTVTAGNSSGVNDGAAAIILASDVAVRKHNLVPMARVLGCAVAGVEPRIMGMGPAPATRKLCSRLRLQPSDFDIVELNEAFASQGIAVLRELGIPENAEHVNPNGGAIALGHPLGMSGARLVGTAALELNLRGEKLAIGAMCVGVGQGIAVAIERV